MQSCRLPRSTIQHHYELGVDIFVLGLATRPSILSNHSTLPDVSTLPTPIHSAVQNGSSGNQIYLKIIGLSLPPKWRHGILGTWMQCPAPLPLTNGIKYVPLLAATRASGINNLLFHLQLSEVLHLPEIKFVKTTSRVSFMAW